MSKPVSLFSDAGLLSANPSALGFTWAYCWLDQDEMRAGEASGVVEAPWHGLAKVSSNVAELYAAVQGLLHFPVGERVIVYTDSEITAMRLRAPRRVGMKGVPLELQGLLQQVAGRVHQVVLLGGHPNRKELYAGVRKDGLRVSIHNVHCDKCCTARSLAWHAARESVAASYSGGATWT